MITILSPSKTMDFRAWDSSVPAEAPIFIEKASTLVAMLQEMSADEIRQLMDISGQLASQTKTRFMEWQKEHSPVNAKPALLAFSGDVYDGLKAETFDATDMRLAQEHLVILSGLYGMLRPLDLMMPFRLELGIQWKTEYFQNLYQYWTEAVNKSIQQLYFQKSKPIILNLASAEYFKLLDLKKLQANVVSPVFAEFNNGRLKTVSIFAKKARGMMARFIIQNRINNTDDIIAFQEDRYAYIPELSTENKPVFAR